MFGELSRCQCSCSLFLLLASDKCGCDAVTSAAVAEALPAPPAPPSPAKALLTLRRDATEGGRAGKFSMAAKIKRYASFRIGQVVVILGQ